VLYFVGFFFIFFQATLSSNCGFQGQTAEFWTWCCKNAHSHFL